MMNSGGDVELRHEQASVMTSWCQGGGRGGEDLLVIYNDDELFRAMQER